MEGRVRVRKGTVWGFLGIPRASGSCASAEGEGHGRQRSMPPHPYPWTDYKGHWGWRPFLFPPSGQGRDQELSQVGSSTAA